MTVDLEYIFWQAIEDNSKIDAFGQLQTSKNLANYLTKADNSES